jgi:hypothetical protein
MNRRNKLLLLGALFMTGAAAFAQFFAQGQSKNSTVTPADYLRWKTEFKNWGRWGADDERGTTTVTPAKIVNVAKLVKTGQVISLAHAEPQKVAADVPEGAVFHRTTLNIGPNSALDNYQVSYHGLSTAHMDAFCHQFADGQMYNGFSVAENVTMEAGCKKGSVMAWRDGIVTRAVLYDMPQLKGVEWIEPGTPITRADLEAWEKKAVSKRDPATSCCYTSADGSAARRRDPGRARSPATSPIPSLGSKSGSRRFSDTISISTGIHGPAGERPRASPETRSIR